MNNYQSIATINGPEFINLQPLDINPMMSKCEIKVLYLGKNRNGTSISKEAATEMSKTLRGAPIVGYYRPEKGDFFDHGDQMIMDGDGIHFNCLTKPYGFVSPDAEVWFQEFEEFDETGESTLRIYLMTTGYLWTGQFQEAQQIFNEGGKPHSMELDENSMSGFWSKEANSECEFFIINDAIFSKLCILGDDVEPCFEGSSITAPNISKNFTLDDSFKKTLFSMMKELQYALQGGNHTVENEIKKVVDSSEPIVEETPEVVEPVEEPAADPVVETPAAEPEEPTTDNTETNTENSSNEESGNAPAAEGATDGGDGGDGASDYAKEEEKKDDKEDSDKPEDKEAEKEDEKDKEEDKYALIVQELEELKANYSALEEENKKNLATLAEYKQRIEEIDNKEKDALIAEFTMLSEEDKKEVIEHKAEYSLAEIKSKLAVICYDKKVSYTVAQSKAEEGMTVDVIASDSKPEWVRAIDNRKKQQEQ